MGNKDLFTPHNGTHERLPFHPLERRQLPTRKRRVGLDGDTDQLDPSSNKINDIGRNGVDEISHRVMRLIQHGFNVR